MTPKSTKLKPTQFRELYDALGALKEQEQTALAEMHAEDPTLLIHRIRHSVATVKGYAEVTEKFHEDDREPLDDPPTPVEQIKKTPEFASQLADGELRAVTGSDGLDFRFLDREIFPLRSTDKDLPHAARRWLDLLLVNSDGTPIVGELKIQGDKPTYFAFVQALMYAVELTSPDQLERLKQHYPMAGFGWPADGPYVDIYLIAFDPPKTGKYRERSFHATEKISKHLVQNEEFSAWFRRIAYIEASAEKGELRFDSRFSFA
jgi:hypothetical protein